MKVKDVLRDLGPKTLVQIYKPSTGGYVERFQKAYSVSAMLDPVNVVWVDKYMNKEIDHVEYSHYYTTADMVSSCNIYLKDYLVKTVLMSTYGVFAKTDDGVGEEKPSTIDYTDLKKKWDRFCKQFYLESSDPVRAGHISTFFELLSNGELVEMEDKDLS